MAVPGLSEHVLSAEFPSEDYLVSNPEYIPVVFDANLKDSVYWKSYEQWKGTVFGDIPPGGDFSHFTLEPVENGVHICVRDNAGKISAVTDGIAMYYTTVPSGVNFTFSAKVTLNDYFMNDQVSFGLMVRDDCYIDMQTPQGLGDFVAAGPFHLTRHEHLDKCFARKNSNLFLGPAVCDGLEKGKTYDCRIISSNDGYSLFFGDDEAVTGGFDFRLTSIDPDHVYAGMFVSRNADVTFTDIKLEFN